MGFDQAYWGTLWSRQSELDKHELSPPQPFPNPIPSTSQSFSQPWQYSVMRQAAMGNLKPMPLTIFISAPSPPSPPFSSTPLLGMHIDTALKAIAYADRCACKPRTNEEFQKAKAAGTAPTCSK